MCLLYLCLAHLCLLFPESAVHVPAVPVPAGHPDEPKVDGVVVLHLAAGSSSLKDKDIITRLWTNFATAMPSSYTDMPQSYGYANYVRLCQLCTAMPTSYDYAKLETPVHVRTLKINILGHG